MTKRPGSLSVKKWGGLLIQDGRALLLHDPRLLPRDSIAVQRQIQPFRSSWLPTRKVITGEQHGDKNRMIDVHARIDHGNDSSAGDPETIVRIRQPNDLPSRLPRVSMGNDAAKIVHRRGVGQPVRHVIDRGQRDWQGLVPLDALNSQQRFEQVYDTAQQSLQIVLSRRSPVGSSGLAPYPALPL